MVEFEPVVEFDSVGQPELGHGSIPRQKLIVIACAS